MDFSYWQPRLVEMNSQPRTTTVHIKLLPCQLQTCCLATRAVLHTAMHYCHGRKNTLLAHYAVFMPGLNISQGCLMYSFGCWPATWTCTLLVGAHRMLPGRRATVERWRPPHWCQAGPAWRQTPLLTGAPAVWSLLKSRILSMPSSPAMCRTHLCERRLRR